MSSSDPKPPADKPAERDPRANPGIDPDIGDIPFADASATIADDAPKMPGDWRLALERVVERDMPHTVALNMRVDKLEPGCVTISMPYDARLAADSETGILHDGVIMTLIDTAFGIASFSAMETPQPVATLNLRIDHLRPTAPGERLIADAERVYASRSVAFMRGLAHHGDPSRPVAVSAATFMLSASGFVPLSGGDDG